jgi:hypothetical protein
MGIARRYESIAVCLQDKALDDLDLLVEETVRILHKALHNIQIRARNLGEAMGVWPRVNQAEREQAFPAPPNDCLDLWIGAPLETTAAEVRHAEHAPSGRTEISEISITADQLAPMKAYQTFKDMEEASGKARPILACLEEQAIIGQERHMRNQRAGPLHYSKIFGDLLRGDFKDNSIGRDDLDLLN